MKYYRIFIPLLFCFVAFSSCGDDPTVLEMMDFRDEYVGIYDCEKGSTTIELEVSKDPDNADNVLIGPFSIPINQEGDFGPLKIDDETVIHLMMDGTNIFYSEHIPIIFGIVAPCVLEGVKR